MDFGKQIETIRKNRRLTVFELAAKSGVSMPTLSRVRNSERSIGIDTLDKAAHALDMTVVIQLVPKTGNEADSLS